MSPSEMCILYLLIISLNLNENIAEYIISMFKQPLCQAMSRYAVLTCAT